MCALLLCYFQPVSYGDRKLVSSVPWVLSAVSGANPCLFNALFVHLCYLIDKCFYAYFGQSGNEVIECF